MENTSLLILIDGDRGSIYKNIEANQLYDKGVLRINRMATNVAKKYNIDILDLHNVFEEDYSKNNKSFNFINDGHWNSYAHGLVGDALASYIRTNIKPLRGQQKSVAPSLLPVM